MTLKRLVLGGGSAVLALTSNMVDELIAISKPTTSQFASEVFRLLLGASALAMTQLVQEENVAEFWRRLLD
jgi:hypothetical protein